MLRNKQKSSVEVGMKSELIELPSTVTEEELLGHIDKLNNDDSIHGILVQLPLPDHIDENLVIRAIDPKKDVDGFHPENVGKMIIGQHAFLSCTPYGIIKLLERTNTPIKGKHAVIVGRSNIVGKPMGQLLITTRCNRNVLSFENRRFGRLYKTSRYFNCCDWKNKVYW